MDLVCVRCGEPWDLDYVLHEEPAGFKRRGGLIRRCPSCPADAPQLSREEQKRLITIAVLAELHGDDFDALSADLEDLGLV